jgi:hypothetical protein
MWGELAVGAMSKLSEMAWPDAMLDIVKTLPRCYQTSAELPPHISSLLDRIGQKPVLQQQQPQSDPNKKEKAFSIGLSLDSRG